MATIDPRVDAYMAAAPAFAHPILLRLRRAVHAGCPSVVETIRWGRPHFLLDGRILAGMSAFKQHCAFGFWRDREVAAGGKDHEGSGQFDRIASEADLPSQRELVSLVQRAAATAAQPAPAKPRKTPKPVLQAPEDLVEALAGNLSARAAFEALSNSHRREYIEWIVEAKRPQTRARRVAQTIAWLAEGKSRNWKYESR